MFLAHTAARSTGLKNASPGLRLSLQSIGVCCNHGKVVLPLLNEHHPLSSSSSRPTTVKLSNFARIFGSIMLPWHLHPWVSTRTRQSITVEARTCIASTGNCAIALVLWFFRGPTATVRTVVHPRPSCSSCSAHASQQQSASGYNGIFAGLTIGISRVLCGLQARA